MKSRRMHHRTSPHWEGKTKRKKIDGGCLLCGGARPDTAGLAGLDEFQNRDFSSEGDHFRPWTAHTISRDPTGPHQTQPDWMSSKSGM